MGAILRRPLVSILILGTILTLMALTVYLGIVMAPGGGWPVCSVVSDALHKISGDPTE